MAMSDFIRQLLDHTGIEKRWLWNARFGHIQNGSERLD